MITGNFEKPVDPESSMTSLTGSLASTHAICTRGVMISPAVRGPKATERCTRCAVSVSSVPSLADRFASDASSSEERADRSSSWGSTPSARTTALAEPFSSRIGQVITVVKPRMKPWVRRAIGNGLAIASFLGTSSPKSIVATVASTSPSVTAMPGTAPSGTPSPSSGGSSRVAMAGSARKPITRFVRVTPTWAPESWVDRLRSAVRTPWA